MEVLLWLYTYLIRFYCWEKYPGCPRFHDHDLFNPCRDNGLIFEKNKKMMHWLCWLNSILWRTKRTKMNDTYLELDSLENLYSFTIIVELGRRKHFLLGSSWNWVNRKIHINCQYGIDTYPDYRRIGLLKYCSRHWNATYPCVECRCCEAGEA